MKTSECRRRIWLTDLVCPEHFFKNSSLKKKLEGVCLFCWHCCVMKKRIAVATYLRMWWCEVSSQRRTDSGRLWVILTNLKYQIVAFDLFSFRKIADLKNKHGLLLCNGVCPSLPSSFSADFSSFSCVPLPPPRRFPPRAGQAQVLLLLVVGAQGRSQRKIENSQRSWWSQKLLLLFLPFSGQINATNRTNGKIRQRLERV